jgi:dienelactone hydrolase
MHTSLKVLLILASLATIWWSIRWLWAILRSTAALNFMAADSSNWLNRLFYRIETRTEYCEYESHGNMPFTLYRPLSKDTAPAIVLYHGATPYGEEHPALVQLARALAHVGLIVFVPRLPQLKAVIIDETSVATMQEFFQNIQGHPSVAPGLISLAGTSFAGGIMLKALLDESMRQPPPRAVMTYGTYCDLELTLRFILTGRVRTEGHEIAVEPDSWGQVIFFYNYLDHIPGNFNRTAVRKVLEYYVQDLGKEGDKARDELMPAERHIVDLILTPGNQESNKLADMVLEHARPVLDALSPSQFYQEINFPIWTFHGRDDRMVPFTEALAMKRLLGRRVRLHITNIYAHREFGSPGNKLGRIWSTLNLITYYARFLRTVEG